MVNIKMPIRASFFDIDGTLMSGFLIMSFSSFLSERSLFDKNKMRECNKILTLYKSKKLSYRDIAILLPQHYAAGIKGKNLQRIKELSAAFSEEQKGNMYPFSKDLLSLMKKIGPIIAISGSPIESIVAVNNIFGFDFIHGTEVEVRNGTYTGKLIKNMVIKETKEETIHRIAKEMDVDLKQSFGFGDTEQDMAILGNVGHPIALNPNENLLKLCKERGWMHFNKDDDVLGNIKAMIRA